MLLPRIIILFLISFPQYICRGAARSMAARAVPDRIDRITRLISESAIGESGTRRLVCMEKLARMWLA